MTDLPHAGKTKITSPHINLGKASPTAQPVQKRTVLWDSFSRRRQEKPSSAQAVHSGSFTLFSVNSMLETSPAAS